MPPKKRENKKMWCGILGVLSGLLLLKPLTAQVAVVDLAFSGLEDSQKEQGLQLIQERLAEEGVSLLSPEEIEDALVQENSRRREFEEWQDEEQKLWQRVTQRFEEAKRAYRASQFQEAIDHFQWISQQWPDTNLYLDRQHVQELLSFWAASTFFDGRIDDAHRLLAGLLDINPSFELNDQRFPPPLLELFNDLEPRPSQIWEFSANVEDLQVFFLGKKMAMESSRTDFQVELPLENDLFSNQKILVVKSDYKPKLFSLSDLPETISLETMESREIATNGLFRELSQSTTVSPELENVLDRIPAEIFLLGSLAVTEGERFRFRSQWLEYQTDRRSPIVEATSMDLSRVIEANIAELRSFLEEGRVLREPSVPLSDKMTDEEDKHTETAVYKRWWFWPSIGTALGIGIASSIYFLQNQEEARFVVRPADD